MIISSTWGFAWSSALGTGSGFGIVVGAAVVGGVVILIPVVGAAVVGGVVILIPVVGTAVVGGVVCCT